MDPGSGVSSTVSVDEHFSTIVNLISACHGRLLVYFYAVVFVDLIVLILCKFFECVIAHAAHKGDSVLPHHDMCVVCDDCGSRENVLLPECSQAADYIVHSTPQLDRVYVSIVLMKVT